LSHTIYEARLCILHGTFRNEGHTRHKDKTKLKQGEVGNYFYP
jgi:hypothetical protein